MTGRLEIGSLVELRGEQWLLTRAQPFDACTVLSLDGRDRDNAMQRVQVIAPFDRPRPVRSRSLQRRDRTAVLAHALQAIHGATPIDGIWTAATARMDLLAYQLEPALAAIGGATRLLLADAVGLGKTIQAGLVLSELRHRGWITRTLIVCPAGLRETWRRELLDRFSIDAVILDQQSIADRAAAFPPGVNPWLVDSVVIVSIDFVKRAEIMAALDAVPIDLLIADEAHHLAAGTDRGAAAARLALRSPWCVLMSATPHSGDPEAFTNLTRLGRHGEEIRIFRRRRTDLGLSHVRRTHYLDVHLDRSERALIDAVDAYSRAIWTARGRTEHAARLVAITLARRACSSIAAIDRTLRRRRDLLGSSPADAQPRLPWEDVDDSDGDESSGLMSAPGFESLDDERVALDALIDLVSRCSSHAKTRRLMRWLARIDEPVIVFTEFRDTLDAVAQSLNGLHRVATIHGALPRDARTAAVDLFNRGGFDVLVATDAAGEGLNLHHRCRVVIDFELPWNPLRLEQRIGRVDRIGQQRTVHAIRFFHGGTIEQDVLERLALRRQRAEEELHHAVSDGEVAAAVFNNTALSQLTPRNHRARVSPEATAELDRIQEQRRHSTGGGERCWAAPKHPGARRMTCLLRETFATADGTVLGNRIHARTLVMGATPRCPREWRTAIDSVAVASPSPPVVVDRRKQIIRRIAAIRTWLARDQRREYQRSLFDSRAEERQSARQRDAARLDAALGRVERAVAPVDPSRTRVDVVAAWPGRRA